ncbi:MAG: glycosyltransferase [Phycisphaerales bacterium]
MNEPKPPLDLCVSIIARNAQRTIQRTICSVNGLARRVIVVDSGSTDATPRHLPRPRIRGGSPRMGGLWPTETVRTRTVRRNMGAVPGQR